jgi:hypothetical protein
MLARGSKPKRRIAGAVMALTLLIGAFLAGSATPASASIYYDQYRNDATGLCLEETAAHTVRTAVCNGSGAQGWSSGPNGTMLKNLRTGWCLDYSFQFGLRTLNTNGCSNFPYQRWYPYVTYSSVPPHLHLQGGEGWGCLDDSKEFHLRSFGCNGLSYQSWVAD